MFNFKSRTSQTEGTPKEFDSSPDLLALRAKLENERMNRRQAMRKFGMAVMTVALLPSVDELTKLVATNMSSLTADEKTAKAIARRFKHMGAAFATGTMDPNSPYFGADCQDRCDVALINKLKDCISEPNQEKISKAIFDCTIENPGKPQDQITCIVDKLKPVIPSLSFKSAQDYIECCYTLCISGKEGSPPCLKNSKI